jgi:hypothetical protein
LNAFIFVIHSTVQVFSNRPYKKTDFPAGLFVWCSIKDDYRTLVGLEGVNVVNKSDDDDEEGNV